MFDSDPSLQSQTVKKVSDIPRQTVSIDDSPDYAVSYFRSNKLTSFVVFDRNKPPILADCDLGQHRAWRNHPDDNMTGVPKQMWHAIWTSSAVSSKRSRIWFLERWDRQSESLVAIVANECLTVAWAITFDNPENSNEWLDQVASRFEAYVSGNHLTTTGYSFEFWAFSLSRAPLRRSL